MDDIPEDELNTYVSTLDSKQWEKDLYNLTNYYGEGGDETIISVTVYFRFAAGGDYNARAMAEIKTHGAYYSGPTETQYGTAFVTKSWELLANPFYFPANLFLRPLIPRIG